MIRARFEVLFATFLVAVANATTDPGDVQALIRVKAAMDPATIHTASCLGSWDFSLDPCDNKFRELFTCGFDCEADVNGVQRVTSLLLDSSGYKGFLSPFIGNLTQLRYLQASHNFLEGSIPDSIGLLERLIFLDLSSNSLGGAIPEGMGMLRELQSLNLANNLLEGAIPASLNNLVGLTELRIGSNKLTGSLPDLSALTQLLYLDVSNNGLQGEVPMKLPPSVYSLSLKNNQLTGILPRIFDGLLQLNVLDLAGNQLTGPVDETLLAHPSLQQLNLSSNRFTMISVPADLAANSELIALDLSYNQISGPLPAYLASMKRLSSLSLRYNVLTGGIPLKYALKAVAELVGLEPLQRLMLDGNYLRGSLPAPFTKLLPGSMAASFADNCLRSCPERFFFCQGGRQKSESICRLLYRIP